MKNNFEIESKIWEYIDNTCSLDERKQIQQNIESENEWKEIFENISKIHNELQKLTPEEPSLRFTQNVMDEVIQLKPYSIYSFYMNKYFLRGISLFFIIAISTLLIYSLTLVQWKLDSSSTSKFTIPNIDWGNYFTFNINTSFIKLFFAVDIILGLFFLDNWLRKKKVKYS